MADLTEDERKFMLAGEKHSAETYTDQVIRRSSVARGGVIGKTSNGTPVYEQIVNPSYAMDAPVPNRPTEDEQRAFDALPEKDKAREIRNAHAQANRRNDSPKFR